MKLRILNITFQNVIVSCWLLVAPWNILKVCHHSKYDSRLVGSQSSLKGLPFHHSLFNRDRHSWFKTYWKWGKIFCHNCTKAFSFLSGHGEKVGLTRLNSTHSWFQNYNSQVLIQIWQMVFFTVHCLVFVCGLFAASVRLTVHVPVGGRGRGGGGAATPTTTTLPRPRHNATTTATY